MDVTLVAVIADVLRGYFVVLLLGCGLFELVRNGVKRESVENTMATPAVASRQLGALRQYVGHSLESSCTMAFFRETLQLFSRAGRSKSAE
jgi:hypothetical protein